MLSTFANSPNGIEAPPETEPPMNYPKNAGALDRALRVALGLAMLILGWGSDWGAWTPALRVFALYPLITGLAGWCPVYALLRTNTLNTDR